MHFGRLTSADRSWIQHVKWSRGAFEYLASAYPGHYTVLDAPEEDYAGRTGYGVALVHKPFGNRRFAHGLSLAHPEYPLVYVTRDLAKAPRGRPDRRMLYVNWRLLLMAVKSWRYQRSCVCSHLEAFGIRDALCGFGKSLRDRSPLNGKGKPKWPVGLPKNLDLWESSRASINDFVRRLDQYMTHVETIAIARGRHLGGCPWCGHGRADSLCADCRRSVRDGSPL